MIKIKSEKGSVTLFATITMIFMAIFLISMYVSSSNRQIAQLEETKVIKGMYEKGLDNLDQIYLDVINGIAGKKDGSWNEAKGVNSPNLLPGMTAVYWTGTPGNYTEQVLTDTSLPSEWANWYDYNTTTGQSKWANAKTADGSYWVWVPRYAYRIASNLGTSTAGTIEIKFLEGTTNKIRKRVKNSINHISKCEWKCNE